VVLVDSWESVLIDHREKVEKMFLDFPGVKASILHMTSEAASKLIDSFGFIHIDANHYGDNPRIDCECWLPKLEKGGIACFHDYNSSFPAVTEAVNTYTSGWQDLGAWEGLAIRRKP
jgi:hypothetical protein